MNLICKLFGFILNLFNLVVEGIGFALKTVGTVAAEVLGAVTGAVVSGLSDGLGLPKLAVVAGLGLVGWFLLSNKKDKSPQPAELNNMSGV